MSFFPYIIHKCLFYDDSGNLIGSKRVNSNSDDFRFMSKAYFFKPKISSMFKADRLIVKTFYYFYNVNNPEPLRIMRNYEPILKADELRVFIDTSVLKDLNNLKKKNSLFDLLKNPKFLVIIVIIIGVTIFYYANGKKFF